MIIVSACASLSGPATADDDHQSDNTKPVQVNEASSTRPNLNKVLRQNEDWSAFDPAQTRRHGFYGGLDGVKQISLSDDGDVWLSIGGAARARQEYFENFGFASSNDDEFVLTRVRLHGDLHLGDHFRVFVEGKGAFSTTRNLPGGRRPIDVDELALQQAFADILFDVGQDSQLTLRGGRQMLGFGAQRLVSPLPWANAMRAWDGVSAILEHSEWKTHAFWTQFAPVQKFDFNTSDRQTQFFGAYATGPLNKERGINADAYFLGLDQSDATNTFNGTTGAERRYTVGGRLFGKLPHMPVDYDVEAAYQFGDLGAAEINAYMFAAQAGYRFGGASAPRAFIGFDYASGDKSAGGDVQTFNHLFPLGHAFLGYIDSVGRQNVIALNTGLTLQPVDKLTLSGALHFFWREDTSDALYNAGGSVVRAGNLSSERYIGSEIDLTATYKLDPHTTLQVGYSHFFTGDFVDSATPGSSDDIDFVYLQIHWAF